MTSDISTLRGRLQEALGEEFIVADLLGEGGFAAVFRARQRLPRRDVAVKVVDLGLSPSASLPARFVREARTSAQLVHAHIVPIYKVGGYRNEVLYIVMRYVDGPSLRQVLERQPRLSVTDAARIARQVADALGYAHRQGVVHRDVKPDNILLDHSGHVLVTDFGIAKAAQEASASRLTTEGMVVGTPHYMSAEQATGDAVDGRSDIYSLGIVLYQMLAGAPPFDGDSAQAILMKQATATPVPIRRLRSDVPPALAEVIDRMLAKDPAERFQSAEAASRALVEARPAAARDTVRLRRGARAVALTSLAGVGGVAFLAAAAVVALAIFSQPPQISAGEPIPDSLARLLRRQGALAAGDVAEYVFVPRGADDTTLFLVARRGVAVVTPRRVRAYHRDSVRIRYGVNVPGGLRFEMVLALPRARRDTVFRSLSLRDLYEIVPRVERLLGAGSGRATRQLTP